MNQYLQDAEYAANGLIELVSGEKRQLAAAEDRLHSATADLNIAIAKRDGLQKRADFHFEWVKDYDLHEDVDPNRVQWMFIQGAKASEEAKAMGIALVELNAEVDQAQASADQLATQVQDHVASVEALACALLQISQHGIGSVHGGAAWRNHCPPGRLIGTLELRDIIWQARNQATHWDDPPAKPFNREVQRVFAALAAEQGPQFDLTAGGNRSRAVDVIDLLGWSTLAAWQADMSVLLP